LPKKLTPLSKNNLKKQNFTSSAVAMRGQWAVQGRRHKNFHGRPTAENKQKRQENSTIKPLSTISVPCIQGGGEGVHS